MDTKQNKKRKRHIQSVIKNRQRLIDAGWKKLYIFVPSELRDPLLNYKNQLLAEYRKKQL